MSHLARNFRHTVLSQPKALSDSAANFVGRALALIIILALPAVFLSACTTSSESGDSDDALVISVSEEPSNLNPIFGDIHGSVYGDHWPMFSSLVAYDHELELEPDLATELPEVSDDGQTVTVEIRDDAKWHDGEPVTAKDVEFTYNSVLDPDNATALRGLWFDSLDSVKAIDQNTVEFVLNRIDPAFLSKLTTGIIPEHILVDKDLNTAAFNKNPIGSGPFVFKDSRPGESMTLAANEDYYGSDVAVEKVVFRFIEDDDSRVRQLENGAVDIDAQGLKARAVQTFQDNDDFQVARVPGDLLTLTLPTTNDLFDNAEVRRALGLAIDREALVEGLENGAGRPISGPFFPGSWANSDEYKVDFDPARAEKVLTEDGWSENADGVLAKNGKTFEFDLVYGHGGTEAAAALAIRDALTEIGVEVEPTALEYEELQKQIGQGAASLQNLGNAYDPALDLFSTYHSSFADDGDTESNAAQIKDKAIDSAIVAGQTTTDQQERKQAYDRLQEELVRQGSWQYLIQGDNYYVSSSSIKGVDPQIREGHVHGFSRGLLWNIADWSIED